MLTWEWKQDKGFVKAKDGSVRKIYHGNALMIDIWENDKEYQVSGFFIDAEHAKRCLKDNMYQGSEFHFYKSTANKTTTKLAKILAENKITVIWEDEPK